MHSNNLSKEQFSYCDILSILLHGIKCVIFENRFTIDKDITACMLPSSPSCLICVTLQFNPENISHSED